MNDIINTLNLYFGQKAPQIPKAGKEIIVKIAPYAAIVGAIITIPAVLALIGLGTYFSRFSYGYGYGGFQISAILSAIIIILEIIAIPGLFKRNATGWNFSFYAILVGAVQQLLTMQIAGLIISLVIGLYILFQVRPYYFGGATITENKSPDTPPAGPAASN